MSSHTVSTIRRRAGFTLVEIMVVMVIIGLLAAILVPVLGGILRRTNEAAVKVEIGSLESALGDFKARFGCYPPDHVHLFENLNAWNLHPNDKSKILAIWPRFRFDRNRDYLDGQANNNVGEVHLSGAECLVFFLGGMPSKDTNGKFLMTGFSKNPLDPLTHVSSVDESRDGPFFEFPAARLHEHEKGTPNTINGPDGYPEFRDSLNNQTAPYLYLSSSNGRGYDPEGGYVFNHGSENTQDPLVWNRNSPYRQTANGQPWNAKSFQIISPGYGPHEINGSCSEDRNQNGILDPAEVDGNNNGILDPNEDLNGNGRFDPAEDVNGNQILDQHQLFDGQFCPYGIFSVYDPENTGILIDQDADNITNFSAGGRMRQ